ncbi:choice-of-anchor J domain-containing protein, partial [Desulfonatronum sp. SC1]|uniref:Kelch repeat-containing protein n=1 Tax=Desulfonatronum sp. SC1 TaxID=2109626 RepID=UPI0011B2322C
MKNECLKKNIYLRKYCDYDFQILNINLRLIIISISLFIFFTIFSTIAAKANIDESFELSFPPSEWTYHTISGRGWEKTSTQAKTGSYSAMHRWDNHAADAWLITPQIYVSAVDEISFWEYSSWNLNYFKHSMWACVSDCENPPTNWVELQEFGPSVAEWRKQTLSLASYAEKNIYLAFRYEGLDATSWHIDDVFFQPREPLLAVFSGTPTSGLPPIDVQFADESTGNPSGWAWYFGDENLAGAWQSVNAAADWPARDKFAAAVLPDGNIVIAGGYVNVSPWRTNDVWRSSNGGTAWTEMTGGAEWEARTGHGLVALPDGEIVLMGGWADANTNEVWLSEDKGESWTRMTDNAGWSPRGYFAAEALHDGSIVIMGGHSGINPPELGDVWRSTDNGATWTQLTDAAPWGPRSSHSSALLPNGDILLMGGQIPDHPGSANDVWSSSDGGATWNLVTADAPWPVRSNHQSMALPDGSVVLLGGSDGGPSRNDVWRSTDGGATWTQVTESAEWPARMQFVAGVLADGAVVVMGGNVSGSMGRDVWRLDTAGSTEQHPAHTYQDAGSYQVTLQTRDGVTVSTLRRPAYIQALNQHTVIFKDYNDTVLKTEVVTHGSDATPPANPSREGYTFTGWDVDFSNITSDLTVTAQYQINTYTVTPTAGTGGTASNAGTYAHGSTATVTATANPGHVFVNWTEGSTVVSCDAQYSFTVTGNRTLRANFSR